MGEFCVRASALTGVSVTSSGAFSNRYNLGGSGHPYGGAVGDAFYWLRRRTHTSDVWMVKWAKECQEVFGPQAEHVGAAYGETFFSSWLQIFESTPVQAAVASAVKEPLQHASEAGPIVVTILGSGLGYMALFFLSCGLTTRRGPAICKMQC